MDSYGPQIMTPEKCSDLLTFRCVRMRLKFALDQHFINRFMTRYLKNGSIKFEVDIHGPQRMDLKPCSNSEQFILYDYVCI